MHYLNYNLYYNNIIFLSSQSQSQPVPSHNYVLIQKNELDSLLYQLEILKAGQQFQTQQMNEFMNMVREEFKSLRAEINVHKNQDSVDITYKPPVIASIDELNLMEEKLGKMDATFLKDYSLMVRID